MKTKLFTFIVLVLAASCSAPKYTFPFGYYDYQAGKRAAQKEQVVAIDEASKIITSAEPTSTVIEASTTPVVEDAKKEAPAMTKVEKKVFLKEVKKEIKVAKREVKNVNSVQSAQAMDHDLKLAAIFGAIGVVLGALYSVNSIIGFIGFVAIIIGLVFLIKWLLRQ